MASAASRIKVRQVKPILSIDHISARRRVLNLYKLWYREIPDFKDYYGIPRSEKECYQKLREQFMQNAHVTNIRIIDMLVVKGHMALKEYIHRWAGKLHIMTYFKDTIPKKPTDFLSKFLSGKD